MLAFPIVASVLLFGLAAVRADAANTTGSDADQLRQCLSTQANTACPPGCISKAVGATGQTLCALEGADATPFDAQNTITFVGCIEGGQLQTSPECLAALTTHFDAAGCGIVCFQDFFGQGRRGQECALEATQEDCEATVVPCDSTATPTNGTATAPPPSTNVTAPVAPVPMASPGTNTSTAGTGDLGTCLYIAETGGCTPPRCPNDPFIEWRKCASAAAPCPETCAEKPVAGEPGLSVCAIPGFEIDPIDPDTARAFASCLNNSTDPQCAAVINEYAVATGCAAACVAAASTDDPRNAACAAVPTAQQAQCAATTIAAPCPDYPEPRLASDSASVSAPPPASPAPPIAGPGSDTTFDDDDVADDDVDEPDAVDAESDDAPVDTEDGGGSGPGAGSTTAPDFGSTGSGAQVEAPPSGAVGVAAAAAAAAGVACAAVLL